MIINQNHRSSWILQLLAVTVSLLLIPIAGCDSTHPGDNGAAGGGTGGAASADIGGFSGNLPGSTISFPSTTTLVVHSPNGAAGGGSNSAGGGAGWASSSAGFAGLSVTQCAPEHPSGASANICGDGFRSSTEACDDGNTLPEDGCSPTCQITPQLVSPRVVAVREAVRINAGADAVGSFGADRFYSGGGSYVSRATVDTSGVANAAPAEVYQSEHFGDFSYTLSGLKPGVAYPLRLHFAEIWFDSSNVGARVFNVLINGTTVLENFDIVAIAGANKAVVREFSPVADAEGRLVLNFVTVVGGAKLSGIELVMPPPSSGEAIAQIDSGGDGVGTFGADQFVTGGAVSSTPYAIATTGVKNAAPAEVYQSVRYGDFSYTLTGLTPTVIYTVRLHFAETYYSLADARVFNVAINGTRVIENFDVYSVAGFNQAVVREFEAVASADGQIVVSFQSVKDLAILNGLELFAPVHASLPGRTIGAGRHPLVAGCNRVAVAFSERGDESSALYLSTFKSAGQPVSSAQVAQSNAAAPDPGVAALPGDEFVVAWTDFDDDELGISLRKVVGGVGQGKPIVANEDQAFSQSGSDIVFDGNKLVVAWADSHDPTNGPDLHYRVFSPDLRPLTGDQVLAATDAVEDNVVLAGRDGHWAAAWRAGSQGQETIEVQSGGSHWTVGPFLPGAANDRPDLIFLDETHLALAFTMGTDPENAGVANVPRLHAAVLDPKTPGPTESFEIAPAQLPYATQLSVAQTEPSLVMAGDHVFVAWRSSALSGDGRGTELWSRRVPFSVSGDTVTLDLTHIEVPLIQTAAQREGDQEAFRMAATTLWPNGGVVSVWDDSSRSLGPSSGAPDVALQVVPDVHSPCTGVTLTSDQPASYNVTGQYVVQGETITFAATGTCNGLPEYRFVMQQPGGIWAEVQPWSLSNTFVWPSAGVTMGYWNIQVWVRARPGADYEYDAYTGKQILVTDAAACTAATVVSDHPSGYVVTGDVIRWKASSTCSGQPRYKFWILEPGTSSTYTVAQDWSTNDTFEWNTSGKPIGYGNLFVWVSDSVFFTSWYQAYASSSFMLNDYAACTSATLTSDAIAYHAVAGQVVHWTATSACAGPAEYRFVLRNPAGTYSEVRAWSSDNTLTWNSAAQPPGLWEMQVWVRDAPFYDYLQAYASSYFNLDTAP